mgnify:CR=1 FL=1
MLRCPPTHQGSWPCASRWLPWPCTFTRNRDNIKKFIAGELGANLIFKYRALAMIEYADDIADVAMRALPALLEGKGASGGAKAHGSEIGVRGQSRFYGLFGLSGARSGHVF